MVGRAIITKVDVPCTPSSLLWSVYCQVHGTGGLSSGHPTRLLFSGLFLLVEGQGQINIRPLA